MSVIDYETAKALREAPLELKAEWIENGER
jgi:hypothetical protein